jgi:hypothetical protein
MAHAPTSVNTLRRKGVRMQSTLIRTFVAALASAPILSAMATTLPGDYKAVDFDTALIQANGNGKPIMLFFGTGG